MILFSNMKWRQRTAGTLAAAFAISYAASLAWAAAADAGTSKDTKTPAEAKVEKNAPKPARKRITGAELYQINCGRCHPERYASEFTPAQWKSIVTHMRVRANIPAQQAKAILKYLQEDSGTP
jgi:mono/diheme cytochrome c family protein